MLLKHVSPEALARQYVNACQQVNLPMGTKSADACYCHQCSLVFMHTQHSLTEITIASPLTRHALGWIYTSLMVASAYLVRALIEDIPPQDHLALSIILCFLLIQSWIHLEQTRLRISLPHNRCWLRHRHLGIIKEQSIPVSQIHSARLEYSDAARHAKGQYARIVLVTSLGMIPASLTYSDKPWRLDQTCIHINQFLDSQKQLFQA